MASSNRQSRFTSAMAEMDEDELAAPVEVANPVYAAASPTGVVPSFAHQAGGPGAHDSFSMSKRSRLGLGMGSSVPVAPSTHSNASNVYQPYLGSGRQPSAGYTPAMASESNYEEEYLLDHHTDTSYTEGGNDDDDDSEAPLQMQKKRQPPVVHRWNLIPILLFIWFMGASVYYCYVRATMLNHPYAVVIFAIEIVGWTSFFPYALLIMRGVYPTGSPGLPPAGSAEADEQAAWWLSPERNTPSVRAARGAAGPLGSDISASATPVSHYRYGASPGFGGAPGSGLPQSPAVSIPETSYFMYRFHVRVLVPCYKEDLAVIASTVQAALSADLPALTRRTVYLLDDGKDAEKKSFIEGLRLSGEDIVYVSGRIRKKGEVNGKSGNLNNALKNVIYKNYPKNEDGQTDWTEISNKECIVVFDADMNCKVDFFLKLLEVMVDDEIALTLTPQAFYNIDTDMDIFNAINAQFWEYWLPGAFGWGYIACTGTNFMIRARALAHCGFFPDYTITEDYALGMELKARGYKATYLSQYLAVGEAPEEARNVFQQRSRWTKGHYQVFFSGINALLNMQLPFFQRLWYTYAAWAPFVTSLVTPVFMLVPFMSIVFGYNPVSITFEFVLASTIYFVVLQLIQNYCTSWSHVKLMWYVNVSNTVLWFTYVKAFFNTLLLKIGAKVATFKATAKTKAVDGSAPLAPPPALPGAAPAGAADPSSAAAADGLDDLNPGFGAPDAAAVMQHDATSSPDDLGTYGRPTGGAVGRLMTSINARFTPRKSGSDAGTPLADAGAGSARKARKASQIAGPEDEYPYPVRVGRMTPMRPVLTEGDDFGTLKDPYVGGWDEPVPAKGAIAAAAAVPAAAAVSPPAAMVYEDPSLTKDKEGWARVSALFESFKPQNVTEFGKMMDPLALLLMWIFNMGTVGVGIWQLVLTANDATTTSFEFNSPLKGNPYLIISVIWAFYNSMAPYLFLHYCFTAGRTFKFMVNVIMHLSSILMLGAVILVWLLIPTEFEVNEPASLAAMYYLPNSVAQDTNMNYTFVVEKEAFVIDNPDLNAMIQQAYAAVAVGEQPGLDLRGGYLVSDHVKYGMPIAYTVASLAWAILEFPDGISKGRDSYLDVLRKGADYLMRCYIEMPDGTVVYVAQVGDGADYALIDDDGFDPVLQGKVWTSPTQDPQLSGDEARKVWLMTRGRIGADLMAQVSAALAATSLVFKRSDEEFAYRALTMSEKVYQFATIEADAPHSYCEYVPCTANVTYTKQVLAREFVPPKDGEPVCYYLDWNDKACYIGMSIDECTTVALVQKEVYRDRSSCCNAMHNTGIWEALSSKAQGICAVAEGQDHCFIPHKSDRTCHRWDINATTGRGCTGAGLSVYSGYEECCNYLTQTGAISAQNGRPGTGFCSRMHLDPDFQYCYVPVLNKVTCEMHTDKTCEGFGVETVYDNLPGCCNDLLIKMSQLGFNQAGGVQIQSSGVCALYFNQHLGMSGRRSLLERGGDAVDAAFETLTGRKLTQDTTDTSISISIGSNGTKTTTTDPKVDKAPIEESSYWTVPPTVSNSQCANNVCEYILVEDYKTVELYNSTSVLDDLAWAATWMFKATNNALYMGQAQKFIARHYKEDVDLSTMIKDRSYYRSDWNNVAWNVNTMLTGLTGKKEFVDKAELFLKTWVFGNSVNLDTPLPPATAAVDIMNITALGNFTDPDTGKRWIIVPECTPTAKFEDNCFDSIDNNCNGLVDRDDIDCGLFPVQYTPKELAFAGFPSAPLAASASVTALMYAQATDTARTARNLRCWALNQVSYLIGVNPTVSSLVVGYGDNAPTTVQHRGSSCPTEFSKFTYSNPNMNRPRVSILPDDFPYESTIQQALVERPKVDDGQPPCNWDNAYFPSTENPRIDLIKGALIAGPESYYPFEMADELSRERPRKSTRISMPGTVQMMTAAMALKSTETTVRSCELLHGVYQKYAESGEL